MSEFHRIEAVAQVSNTMKVLDLTKPAAREDVLYEDQSAEDFYKPDFAVD